MKKVMVKILQGSVVMQNVLGGLTICPAAANFLQCICIKKLWKWGKLIGSRQKL